ncbi:MAG: hypothetical protein KJ904_01685 [Alphaproteobacteria bacterium]|nr:hypothetical protein [Alphaproteobacteria bacterium]MBU0885855.1 hypothetical protein [Alphaproteobacteria bacterium]MBU1812069.1 hypothetical protein [Alphaproteobacteria bacterium]
MKLLDAGPNGRSQTVGQSKLFDGIHPEPMLTSIWQNGRHAAFIEMNGGNIVADEITARPAKCRCQCRFSGTSDAAQGHPPAPIRNGGCVQNKLSALMKQDAKAGTEEKGRRVGAGRCLVQINDDLASIRDEETSDLRNIEQKCRIVELPRRPDTSWRPQLRWSRTAPDAHIGLRHALCSDDHSRKSEI